MVVQSWTWVRTRREQDADEDKNARETDPDDVRQKSGDVEKSVREQGSLGVAVAVPQQLPLVLAHSHWNSAGSNCNESKWRESRRNSKLTSPSFSFSYSSSVCPSPILSSATSDGDDRKDDSDHEAGN